MAWSYFDPCPWPEGMVPSSSIYNYTGPYPIHELEMARHLLIESLRYPTSDIIERAKPKFGLNSRYGPGMVPPPLDIEAHLQQQRQLDASFEHIASSSQHQLESAKVNENTDDSHDTQSTFTSGPLCGSPQDLTKGTAKTSTPSYSGRKRSLDSPSKDRSVPSKRLAPPSPVPTENPSNVFQMYKCDFCSFASDTDEVMAKHLVSAKHFSGSLYNVSKATGNLEYLSIDKMMAVKNKHSKTSALVVTCSECHDVFEDIFMCGIHYQLVHGHDRGCYSICPVIHHQTAAISLNLDCLACQQPHARPGELFRHWESYPSHLPTSKPSHKNVLSLYICPYCHKTFHQDYEADNKVLLSCHSHVLNHRFSEPHRSKEVFAIEVKHIMLSQRTEKLPPFSSGTKADGSCPGLEDEIKILNNMKRHYKAMSSSKNKRKVIRSRLTWLKQQARIAGVKHSVSKPLQ